jgi:PadR family transcriptional regulator, regulatory protein PadR
MQPKNLTVGATYVDYALMSARLRLSTQTIQVLAVFLAAPRQWRYGYDISKDTGLKSGTLYPILIRLTEHKLLDTFWEASDPGKPPRHMYRLTTDGLRFARQQLQRRATAQVPRPAFSGAQT